jgi:tRNA-specific 2-thiouridylase
MDICFVPGGDYGAYIEAEGYSQPAGNFVDRRGRVLGRHEGIHRYTVGQRRGLGVSAEGRLYVCEIRPDTAEVD